MMADVDFNNVSAHYFDLLVASGDENARVYATEDIRDDSGELLVPLGEKITPDLKELLIGHKLHKPLETLITANYVISAVDISNEAYTILDTYPAFHRIFVDAEKEAAAIANVAVAPLPALLLSVARNRGSRAFQHSVMVALIARLIGKKIRLDESDMEMLTQAAIAHDIGELYMDEGAVLAESRYTPEDWKQTMAHPKIGALLVKHCTSYPPEVARAICEHHEREDGSGYPRKLVGPQISLLGKVLMVSELLSGILLKPDFPVRRALLVLRFMPEEFPKDVLNAVHSLVAETALYASETQLPLMQWDRARLVIDELNHLKQSLANFLETSGSIIELEVAKEAMGKLSKIRHAILNLGLEICLDAQHWETLIADTEIQLEMDVAAREIAWRLRDTARDMVLNLKESNARGTPALKAIIDRMSQVSLN